MATVASSKENKPKAPTRSSMASAENGSRGAQTQSRAVAISNNDIAIIAWNYDAKIVECLGVSIQRRAADGGDWQPLPAWVGFTGGSNDDWQPKTTDEWPVQKFNWRDLTAKRGGTYQYRVVPMIGSPGHLRPTTDASQILVTNEVQLTPDFDDISAYFNRGIMAMQAVSRALPKSSSDLPNYRRLKDRIDQPGDSLRSLLAGQILEALERPLNDAELAGGRCYCALYELNDPELLQQLMDRQDVEIILSNTGADDETNAGSRQSLHESGTEVHDRMLGSQHIGHNKFVIYADDTDTPQYVLTGSTNWTYTGVCGQANNAIILRSPELAQHYRDYWQRLLDDDSKQGPDFREANMEGYDVKLKGNSSLRLWFSPNTRQKSKPKNPAPPPDMAEAFAAIGAAKQAILFLAFQPGEPSIIDATADAQNKNAKLFVRGAVTDSKAAETYETDLYHRSGDHVDATVEAATAIHDEFAYWQAELLKTSPFAHAIIHDKIVVIDPFSDDCVVITGSHNLGYRASYNNDENLLLIRGNRRLAAAYAAHVLDIYDHYRWRNIVLRHPSHAWSGLSTDPRWQDFYFKKNSPAKSEFAFWAASGAGQ